MTQSETAPDPRAMDDDELQGEAEPPAPSDPSLGSTAVVEDDYAEGRTSDPDGAQQDVPAGEDYAGSGF